MSAFDDVTEAERRTLETVLRAMREAVRRNNQCNIIFDPFSLGGGAHLFVGFDSAGHSHTIEGTFKRGRKPHERKARDV